MKNIKGFNSFQLNEGILNDMKSKVKGWFKGDEQEKLVGQPRQISNGQWREILSSYGVSYINNSSSSWTSGGIVPFTKEEIKFLKKYTHSGYTWDEIKAEIHINCKIKITKLDEGCYLIHFNNIPAGDISGENQEYLETAFTKCFICDRWEEVVAYLKLLKSNYGRSNYSY
jgi:hypothetical protein